MSVLLWIIVASICGGALSVVCAAAFALNPRAQRYLSAMVSYAIGAMLGAVFLDILPEAIKLTSNVAVLSGSVLFGILLFFILEKLVLWRHCHLEHCEAHELLESEHTNDHGDHGRSGMMIMVGDTFHNFVDGVIIAAAFLTDMDLAFEHRRARRDARFKRIAVIGICHAIAHRETSAPDSRAPHPDSSQ